MPKRDKITNYLKSEYKIKIKLFKPYITNIDNRWTDLTKEDEIILAKNKITFGPDERGVKIRLTNNEVLYAKFLKQWPLNIKEASDYYLKKYGNSVISSNITELFTFNQLYIVFKQYCTSKLYKSLKNKDDLVDFILDNYAVKSDYIDYNDCLEKWYIEPCKRTHNSNDYGTYRSYYSHDRGLLTSLSGSRIIVIGDKQSTDVSCFHGFVERIDKKNPPKKKQINKEKPDYRSASVKDLRGQKDLSEIFYISMHQFSLVYDLPKRSKLRTFNFETQEFGD